MHFLQAGRKRATLPGTEESMTTTIEFITALFCQVDDQLAGLPKHPHANLWPSEIVTLGLLHALKGGGNRAFYRWLTRDYRALFPQLPERTRLFRLFKTHHDWTTAFLATPTVLGVIDTYGIELIHPMREGRSPRQIGRKGLSNHRWIVGGKLCLLLNQWGLVVGWACAHLRVLKHMNYDGQDQNDLPIQWCCEIITTIFRRAPCWSKAMIAAIVLNDKDSPSWRMPGPWRSCRVCLPTSPSRLSLSRPFSGCEALRPRTTSCGGYWPMSWGPSRRAGWVPGRCWWGSQIFPK